MFEIKGHDAYELSHGIVVGIPHAVEDFLGELFVLVFVYAVHVGLLLDAPYPFVSDVAHLSELQLVRVYVVRELLDLVEAQLAASVRPARKAEFEDHDFMFSTI